MKLEEPAFDLELPERWKLMRDKTHGWTVGAHVAEIERADGKVDHLRVAFGVYRHPRDAMVSLMWKRTHVALEKLEPESTEVSGRKATLVCWTDGVADIASWFVEEQDALVEFSCAGPGLMNRDGIEPGEQDPLPLGRRILQSLRWAA